MDRNRVHEEKVMTGKESHFAESGQPLRRRSEETTNVDNNVAHLESTCATHRDQRIVRIAKTISKLQH